MTSVPAPDGALIDVEITGEGPDVVLVHGITESRASWGSLADDLATDHRVIAMDLRGHGGSSVTPPYDLATMAGDVGAVLAATGAESPLLIGHSLGAVVVTATAAAGVPCRGVVNIDQALLLAGFQDGLLELEPMLRGEPDQFDAAIAGIFDSMIGPLGGPERQRIDAGRRARQEVVLGVWDVVLTSDASSLDAMVSEVAGGLDVPFLAVHGIDPGPEYETWVRENITGAEFEVWAETGHYPHLVHPVRFLERVRSFDARI